MSYRTMDGHRREGDPDHTMWVADPIPGRPDAMAEPCKSPPAKRRRVKTPLPDDDGGAKSSSIQARAWCFTAYDENVPHRLHGVAGVLALVVGREICPTTSRTHYQGYVRFSGNKRFSWWRNQFPGLHVEVRAGTETQAAEYCRKDGDMLYDRGVMDEVPKSAGTIEDQILDMLEARAPLYQIYRAHRVYFFRNSRRIVDMEAHMQSWRENYHAFEKNT